MPEVDTLHKLVEIVEIKWNEQEMEHMREELNKNNEKLTEITIESAKFRSEILETIDRELLCSICSDIFFQVIKINGN